MHPAPGRQPGHAAGDFAGPGAPTPPPLGWSPPAPGFANGHPGYPPPAGPFPPGPPSPGHFAPHQVGSPDAAAPSLPMLGAFAAVVLIAVGLSMPFDSSSAWATQTTWSIFAIVAALVVVLPFLVRGSTRSPRTWWIVGAAGAVGVLGHWLLIVLPSISSNQGFVLTLGAALAGLSCWFSPVRPR